MSFSEIELPGIIISEIYKRSLVLIPGTKNEGGTHLPKAAAEAVQIGYLGSNVQRVLILVDYPEELYLPKQEFDFLINILKACQLNIQDIAIVNIRKAEGDFNDILSQLIPKSILLFGIEPSYSAVISGIKDFTITKIDQVQIINSPGLEKLNQRTEESKVLKRKLWENLKEFFNV